jgi:glyoxylase-like metal-dependent hydrolase (beta-lactamase superfamily II)
MQEARMGQDPLFERLWSGAAPMEEWTQAVADGAVTTVAANVVTVHTTYFCGSVTAIRTAAGLVLIDTANAERAERTLAAIRRWDDGRVHTVIYTHGHIDHTGGIGVIDADAHARGAPRPRIIAHRDVRRRLERYQATQGFNSIVQGQQFNHPDYTYPVGQRPPDEVYDDTLSLTIGGERFELLHGRGETDDATFVWLPERRVLASGDFVIWMFPNAGNPRKVQRYAAEWAAARGAWPSGRRRWPRRAARGSPPISSSSPPPPPRTTRQSRRRARRCSGAASSARPRSWARPSWRSTSATRRLAPRADIRRLLARSAVAAIAASHRPCRSPPLPLLRLKGGRRHLTPALSA